MNAADIASMKLHQFDVGLSIWPSLVQCLAQTPEHSCKNLQIIAVQGKFWMQSNNLQPVLELLANAKMGQV